MKYILLLGYYTQLEVYIVLLFFLGTMGSYTFSTTTTTTASHLAGNADHVHLFLKEGGGGYKNVLSYYNICTYIYTYVSTPKLWYGFLMVHFAIKKIKNKSGPLQKPKI